MGGAYQQEVDLHALFKDVAHEYVQTLMVPAQARGLVDRAVRIALAERTVTCIILPSDVQELPHAEPEHAHVTVHTGIGRGWLAPRVVPRDEHLREAAELLNAGQRVAMLVGAGARGAATRWRRWPTCSGPACAKALLGKDVLDDDLPCVTGSIGLLGTKPSWDLMSDCDTLLMVGSSFPYAEFLPKEGQARGGADRPRRAHALAPLPDGADAGRRRRETLRALLPLLAQGRSLLARADRGRGGRAGGGRARRARCSPPNPINPQRLFWELSSRLPDRTHPARRLGLLGQLVRARPASSGRG